MATRKKTPMQQQALLQADLIDTSSKLYDNFFAKMKGVETSEPQTWSLPQIIGYFVYRFEKHFGVKYTFKLDRVPSKSYETFQAKRFVRMLAPNNGGANVKEYIDWVFDKKVNQAKFRVIGFMANESFVTEFKMNRVRSLEISRSTILTPTIIKILEDFGIKNVVTYGDLAFMKGALDGGEESYEEPFNKLIEVGFDISSLKKVK
jgi:hypothetical protein